MDIRTEQHGLKELIPVPWRPGLALPPRMHVTVDDKKAPYIIGLELVVEGGEVKVVSVRFERREGGESVTPRGLRSISVGAYVKAATTANAFRVEENPQGREFGFVLTPITADDIPRTLTAAGSRKGRWRLDESHLRAVAKEYTAAAAAGRPVRVAIQQRWSVPPSTAARWIRAARPYMEEGER